MTKLQAIEQTIYNVENGIYQHWWAECNSCNCGVLAKTLLGGEDVYDAGFHDSPDIDNTNYGVFSRKAYCMKTDLPLPKVFQLLKDAGFTYGDLRSLEFLSDETITKKAGLPMRYDTNVERNICVSYYEKISLVSYLKAWAEILRAEQMVEEKKPEEIKPKTKTVYVAVPTSISKQELVLN